MLPTPVGDEGKDARARQRLYFVGCGGVSWRDPRNWSRSEGGAPLRHLHARGGDVLVVGRVEGHTKLDLRGMRNAGLELRGYGGELRVPDGGWVRFAEPATWWGRLRARLRREVVPIIPPAFRTAVAVAGGWRRVVRDGLATLRATERGVVVVPVVSGGAFTRFWVGGSGTWDAASTTHWSATSGGVGGLSAPTSADTAVFDSNSGLGAANATVTVVSGAACAALTMTAAAGLTGKSTYFTFNANLTVSGTVQLGGGTVKGTSRLMWQSNTVGTQRTITAAAYVVIGDVDFEDINLAYSGAASWTNAGPSYVGDCGGNAGAVTTNATVSAAQAWSGTAGGNWSSNAWTSRVPLPQDDATLGSAFAGAPTITVDVPRMGRSINFTGASAVTVTRSGTTTSYGSLTLVANVTWTTGNHDHTFAGRSAYTLTTAAKALVGTGFLYLNAPGGTIQQADNYSEGASNSTLAIYNGTWDANNHNVTVGAVTTGVFGGTQTLTCGTGTWTLTGVSGGFSWSVSGSQTTLSAASATITITGTAGGAFLGGGKTYGTLNHTINGGSLDITDTGNTFATLNVVANTSNKNFVVVTGGSVTVTGTLSMTGSGGGTLTVDNEDGLASSTTKIFLAAGAALTQTSTTVVTADIKVLLLLAPSFAGTSSLTPTLLRTRQMTPSFAGTSSLTVTVSRVPRAIKPTFAGTSTLTPTLLRTRQMTPSFTGTSSLTVTVTVGRVPRSLGPSFAGSSSLTVALIGARLLAPSFAGTSSLAVTVSRVPRSFSPSFAGTSSLTAALLRARLIVPSFVGTSSIAVVLSRSPRAFSPSFAGTSSLTVALLPTRLLAPSFAGTSSLTVVVSRAPRAVPVTFAGSSSLTTVLIRARLLAPSFAGTSSISVVLSRSPRAIISTFAGTSSFTPTLLATRQVVPMFTGTSALTVTVSRVPRALPATFAGTSSLEVAVISARVVTPLFAGSSSLTVVVNRVPLSMRPSFAGTSSLSAVVTPERVVAATFAGSSSLSVNFTLYRRVAVGFAGVGSLSVTVTPTRPVAATFSGRSSLGVDVSRLRGMAPSFVGRSSFTAAITKLRIVPVTFSGTSSLVPVFVAYRRVGVAFAGTSSFTAAVTIKHATVALTPPLDLVFSSLATRIETSTWTSIVLDSLAAHVEVVPAERTDMVLGSRSSRMEIGFG